MFRKIADGIKYPQWVKDCPRYKRLDTYDRLLDGTFYDHLVYAFYDEMESGRIIKLDARRPSAQFRLPRMVARWSSRKLFAGRHRPKLRLKDAKAPKPVAGKTKPKPKTSPSLKALNTLLRRSFFWQKMGDAVLRGSVGSVAITFRVEDEGNKARLALSVWQAKFCQPSFDEFGALAQLRVAYTTSGAALKAAKFVNDNDGKPIEDTSGYWFIRDFLPNEEKTYIPVPKDQWNPENGFVADHNRKVLAEFDIKHVQHGLGFVPGHWFVNMTGGTGADGECTWVDAIPNSIELDYTLSQLGRGTRYNAAPQLVVVGTLLNDDGDTTRGPMTVLQVSSGYKQDDGDTVGAGDAKLLEMTGTGIKAGLELIDKLRNFALEQIAAQRKDPDKMKAPMSGRAMEYLDEESDDLIMELRSQYGEDGALPLVRKIALATKVMDETEAGALILQWPRLFQPTPDELFALVQSLQIAVDPMGHAAQATPGEPKQPSTPSATGPAKPGKPAVPPQEAQVPEEANQFMSVDEAREYWRLQLDIAMLDIEDGDDTEEVDESPTPPGDVTDPVPPPSAIDEDVPPDTPEGDQDQVPPSTAIAQASMGDDGGQ